MLDSIKLLIDLCNECWASDSQTRRFYGTRCRDIPKGLFTQVKKELRSLTSHTITQLEFLIFLCEHSLLGGARGPVTQ
jgi:hypothetical protein